MSEIDHGQGRESEDAPWEIRLPESSPSDVSERGKNRRVTKASIIGSLVAALSLVGAVTLSSIGRDNPLEVEITDPDPGTDPEPAAPTGSPSPSPSRSPTPEASAKALAGDTIRTTRVPSLFSAAVDLQALSDMTLPGADGEDHRLGEYWADRPIVLVFLRHFG